jgi:hypothetical protein
MVNGLEARVWGSGFRVSGGRLQVKFFLSGVYGLGFSVQGSGFRVQR